MTVEIREDFVVYPSAAFAIGEIVDVDHKIATGWIKAGRAVAVAVPAVKSREKATTEHRKRNLETR